MKKVKIKTLLISKSDIKKLFRKATEFCEWDEYEKGYKYRDSNAVLGITKFIEGNVNVKSTNNIIVDFKELHAAIREVIDESYLFYYNMNGTFNIRKAKVDERNKLADSLSKTFLESLT